MDLAKTQFLSLVAKAVTTALGIIQSIIVIRLLSAAEFGLVGLVMSIGGVIGVTQHLGIVDGAIREIAVRKDKREIGTVYWVSHLTRQLVTIPLSLLLIVFASFIATRFYHRPEITFYIQLFAIVLILQGLQDVLGATLTGLKQFVTLYIVQIVTATINIAVFGYLTWRLGIAGFFWAVIITTSIMVGLFIILINKQLKGYLSLPSWQDIRSYGRRVMKIGAFMYIARILFVLWQRLPILILGGVITSEQLGYLNASLTFGSKLTIIAAALSEVNLAWMSSLFATDPQQFRRVVERNMQRVFILMLGLTAGLIFFTPEIVQFIIGPEYGAAIPLILVMTIAFFLYSLTDIATSSLFVSADEPKLRAGIYGTMSLLSAAIMGILFIFRPDSFLAAIAVLAGIGLAYILVLVIAKRRFQITLLPRPLLVFLVALLGAAMWLLTNPHVIERVAVFAVLAIYTIWKSHRHHLLPATISSFLSKTNTSDNLAIICFAGAAYDQLSWTNRQHMMSRISKKYPVLYVEPRKWIFRILVKHWHTPSAILSFVKRVLWYEKKHDQLFIKAQWNILPGSREIKFISQFNHYLNRFFVTTIAHQLGFTSSQQCVWIYDTEAVEYLDAFPQAFVLYDCVDDHAAHEGAKRNPRRVHDEEAQLFQRADLVTVTSKKLFELKKKVHPNTHLVLNAGDVSLFSQPASATTTAKKLAQLHAIAHPILGSVGALDSYKIDFELLQQVAQQRPQWQFVFIGEPVVDQHMHAIEQLQKLPNVHFLGGVPRQEVPAYVTHFDLCLIPYRHSQYNEASFPLKFWEFMATGKPVLVSGLPELQEYNSIIGYADSVATFITKAEYWLHNAEQDQAERIALAAEHSWEKRVERVMELLVRNIKAGGSAGVPLGTARPANGGGRSPGGADETGPAIATQL